MFFTCLISLLVVVGSVFLLHNRGLRVSALEAEARISTILLFCAFGFELALGALMPLMLGPELFVNEVSLRIQGVLRAYPSRRTELSFRGANRSRKLVESLLVAR